MFSPLRSNNNNFSRKATQWLYCLLLLLLFPILHTHAQLPEDEIGDGEIDLVYLEHLVKIGVDSVRKAHGLQVLVNDSILFVAARHHAGYLKEKNSISHFEPEYEDKKDPQARAEFFGAKNYAVGENVLKTKYNKDVKSKTGQVFKNYTYGVLARSMVDGWVNSPRHYKNMITPEWQLTGVALQVNPKTNTVFAVQKFATKRYQYTFHENKQMFPHSDYETPVPVSSFEGIPSTLVEKEHEWELKHPEPEVCDSCNKITQNPPEMTLRLIKRNFVLRIEDADYVKHLLHKKKDGFAVELVVFNDYMCGNPSYYTKYSRRNGQCTFNGTILEPVYRNDLLSGFKRKKRKEDHKFVNYIFGNDSVPFFERFWRFKMDKYSSQYFQIRLGRLPRDFDGYFEHNLLYLQDEQLCHVDYFTSLCGTLLEDERPIDQFLPDTVASYDFTLDTLELEFTIPFEKNKTAFNYEDILAYTSKLTELEFEVDSLFIDAYSSVEGDSVANENLQMQRALSMVQALQAQQISSIRMQVKTHDSWEAFYNMLKLSPKWRFLSKYPKPTLQRMINESYADTLEPILARQRRADVRMTVSIPVTDKNRAYYIKKTWKNYTDSLRPNSLKDPKKFKYLKKVDPLYKYTYKYVNNGRLDTAVLAGLAMPNHYRDWSVLQEKFIWYGFRMPQHFGSNKLWQDNVQLEYPKMMDAFLAGDIGLTDEFVYNYCVSHYFELLQDTNATLTDWQRIFDLADMLEGLYGSGPVAKTRIQNLVFNLHQALLNKGYYEDPFEHYDMARKSLAYVILFYEQEGGLPPEKALALARMCTYYQCRDLAFAVLNPFVQGDTFYPDLFAYYTILIYRHVSDDPNGEYYNMVLALYDKLGKDRWCNMFLGECGIPFQAFDHEALRDRFCAGCREENRVLKGLVD